MVDKIKKTEAEWRQELSPQQYAVLRQKATERPFTGEYVHNKSEGVYTCAACGQALFDSHTKFESGTGWTSFWDVIEKGNVYVIEYKIHGMYRVEAALSL